MGHFHNQHMFIKHYVWGLEPDTADAINNK